MASSLGYALMSWSTEFARHTKTKMDRKRAANKKGSKKHRKGSGKEQQQQGLQQQPTSTVTFTSSCNTSHHGDGQDVRGVAGSEFDGGCCIVEYDRITRERFPSLTRQIEESVPTCETEAQTDAMQCDRCLELSDEICHLVSQLTDVELIQEDLRRKLSVTKTNLATSIDRETNLRDTNESLSLDEAQLRYELDNLKTSLLHQLEEKEQTHKEQMKVIRQAMSERETEWANRNESLQKQLTQTLRTALQDNEREDLSLSSLEKEISSLQSVIELRGSENRQLREENNKLKTKMEDHAWLETELNKAKHRLEELAIIVQNKMVSERELLELSEALQRDLVRSRAETVQLRQQLENQRYIVHNNQTQDSNDPRHVHKAIALSKVVQHSKTDLYNNTVNNNLLDNNRSSRNNSISSVSTASRKLSSLDRIRDWNDLTTSTTASEAAKAITDKTAVNTTDQFQHQKASSGKQQPAGGGSGGQHHHPDLVLDVREKGESVSWILQMEPTATAATTATAISASNAHLAGATTATTATTKHSRHAKQKRS